METIIMREPYYWQMPVFSIIVSVSQPSINRPHDLLVSLLQGYKQRKAYIATQGPMEGTVADLWRMIWEHNCSCIVMLCQTQEKGQVSSLDPFTPWWESKTPDFSPKVHIWFFQSGRILMETIWVERALPYVTLCQVHLFFWIGRHWWKRKNQEPSWLGAQATGWHVAVKRCCYLHL